MTQPPADKGNRHIALQGMDAEGMAQALGARLDPGDPGPVHHVRHILPAGLPAEGEQAIVAAGGQVAAVRLLQVVPAYFGPPRQISRTSRANPAGSRDARITNTAMFLPVIARMPAMP
jgi:hypothetical protein